MAENKQIIKPLQQFQKQAIHRPNFACEQQLYKLLKNQYARLIKQLLSDLKKHMQPCTIGSLTQDSDKEENDSVENLMKFFEETAQMQGKAQEAADKARLKSFLESVRYSLAQEWNEQLEQEEENPDSEFSKKLFNILLENQKKYTKHFNITFSIDKRQFYNEHMKEIRTIYLDNSIQRIKGEKDLLKKKILEKINGYVTGKADTLDIKELTKSMLDSSARAARFFARDQLARVNKASTIATFISAGVTKVKWLTSNDVRVRDSHKELHNKIFDINNLPKEIDAYNCRCALIPAEYAE